MNNLRASTVSKSSAISSFYRWIPSFKLASQLHYMYLLFMQVIDTIAQCCWQGHLLYMHLYCTFITFITYFLLYEVAIGANKCSKLEQSFFLAGCLFFSVAVSELTLVTFSALCDLLSLTNVECRASTRLVNKLGSNKGLHYSWHC